jgi:hypothetical protein
MQITPVSCLLLLADGHADQSGVGCDRSRPRCRSLFVLPAATTKGAMWGSAELIQLSPQLLGPAPALDGVVPVLHVRNDAPVHLGVAGIHRISVHRTLPRAKVHRAREAQASSSRRSSRSFLQLPPASMRRCYASRSRAACSGKHE